MEVSQTRQENRHSPQSPSKALQVLNNVFGYSDFRPQQREIIEHLIAGRDAVVIMPTGGGKSLCYQVPSLVRQGTGVVISPLIALMQDQVATLQQLGIQAEFLNSTMSFSAARKVEERLLRGDLDIVYMAPERLVGERTLDLLDRCQISLFAIDEAHCVSQWGHDFRPEYMQLSFLKDRFSDIPCMALTATADRPTRADIVKNLKLGQAKLFSSSVDRPNIKYTIVQKESPKPQLWSFLQTEHPEDAGIVYCTSRKEVEKIAEWLNTKGRRALPYHAGLSTKARKSHQDQFLNEEGLIVVATIAFGMGIDKPNVRFVAHLNLPKSIEAYYQETGRAGRDGLPSNAWMAYGLQDMITLRQFIESSNSNEQRKRTEMQKLQGLLGLCENTSCRRQALLSYFGEDLKDPCGNCDNCLSPPEVWNGSVEAQKALSCVYRTGQRFGVNYVIDVLVGKDDPRIHNFGHDRLSTFAIGKDHTIQDWRRIFRQLIAKSLLDVDLEGFGGLRLTQESRPVLRGEKEVWLRKTIPRTKPTKKSKQKFSFEDTEDQTLWQSLREWRSQLAKEQNVPPYVIFHDVTLKELTENRPHTMEQLTTISGIGQSKRERYGEAVLRVLRSYPCRMPQVIHPKPIEKPKDTPPEIEPPIKKDPGPSTQEQTLILLNELKTPEAVAEKRNLSLNTIYSHICLNIEQGQIPLSSVIQITDEDLHLVKEELKKHFNGSYYPLKPVYDGLKEAYDYNVLKCIRSQLQREDTRANTDK